MRGKRRAKTGRGNSEKRAEKACRAWDEEELMGENEREKRERNA